MGYVRPYLVAASQAGEPLPSVFDPHPKLPPNSGCLRTSFRLPRSLNKSIIAAVYYNVNRIPGVFRRIRRDRPKGGIIRLLGSQAAESYPGGSKSSSQWRNWPKPAPDLLPKRPVRPSPATVRREVAAYPAGGFRPPIGSQSRGPLAPRPCGRRDRSFFLLSTRSTAR